jgi:hypothetical protein
LHRHLARIAQRLALGAGNSGTMKGMMLKQARITPAAVTLARVPSERA